MFTSYLVKPFLNLLKSFLNSIILDLNEYTSKDHGGKYGGMGLELKYFAAWHHKISID